MLVSDLVDAGPAVEAVADDAELVGVLQLHAEALRKSVGARVVDDVRLIREQTLEALVRLRLTFVGNARNLGHRGEVVLKLGALIRRDVVRQEDGDLDLARPLIGRARSRMLEEQRRPTEEQFLRMLVADSWSA